MATLNESERYHLLPSKLREASPSWQHYTMSQRSTLRALQARHADVAKSDAVAVPEGGRACHNVVHESSSAGRHSGVMSRESVARKASLQSDGLAEARRKAPAPQIDAVPKLRTQEECRQCKATFEKKCASLSSSRVSLVHTRAYIRRCTCTCTWIFAGRWRASVGRFPRYQHLDRELAAQTKFFEHLEAEFHAALHPSERAVLARRISLAFEERQEKMRKDTEEYRALHLELKRLKQAVSQYVEGRGR